jgi:flagellar biogenesis protein FliO
VLLQDTVRQFERGLSDRYRPERRSVRSIPSSRIRLLLSRLAVRQGSNPFAAFKPAPGPGPGRNANNDSGKTIPYRCCPTQEPACFRPSQIHPTDSPPPYDSLLSKPRTILSLLCFAMIVSAMHVGHCVGGQCVGHSQVLAGRVAMPTVPIAQETQNTKNNTTPHFPAPMNDAYGPGPSLRVAPSLVLLPARPTETEWTKAYRVPLPVQDPAEANSGGMSRSNTGGSSQLDRLLGFGSEPSSGPTVSDSIGSEPNIDAAAMANAGLSLGAPAAPPSIRGQQPIGIATASHTATSPTVQTAPAQTAPPTHARLLPLAGSLGTYSDSASPTRPDWPHDPAASNRPPQTAASSWGTLAPDPTVARPVANQGIDVNAMSGSNVDTADPLHSRLPGPRQTGQQNAPTEGLSRGAYNMAGRSLLQTGIALLVVLALLFVCVWFVKRAAPRALQALPKESIEVLGNAPLHGKQHLKLIRVGNRLLLLAVSDQHSQTLAEVYDPAEVQQLLEMCQAERATSARKSFESILQEGQRESTLGFLGSLQDELSASRRQEPVTSGPTDRPSRASVRPVSPHFFEA